MKMVKCIELLSHLHSNHWQFILWKCKTAPYFISLLCWWCYGAVCLKWILNKPPRHYTPKKSELLQKIFHQSCKYMLNLFSLFSSRIVIWNCLKSLTFSIICQNLEGFHWSDLLVSSVEDECPLVPLRWTKSMHLTGPEGHSCFT